MKRTTWGGLLAICLGISLYTWLANLTLPRGRRPGLKPLTLAEAAQQLRDSGKTDLALVEAARSLVADRMVYCRRNSFDLYTRAFDRGYGYCQQQAFALADLLGRLGFSAQVVHAFRNRFPDGHVGGHAWVEVRVGKETHYVDSIAYDGARHAVDFVPLGKVRGYSPLFRAFAGWGSAAVNAHRFYLTGKDGPG